MGPFNNRELATVIWLVVFALLALGKPNIRRSVRMLVRTACHVKIITLFISMLFYTAAIIAVLAAVNFWDISLLKDTVLWFCVSATAMVMHFMTSYDVEDIFRKVAVDSVKAVILLEFIVNTYTFPLILELVFFPIITFVIVLGVFADSEEGYAPVSKLMKAVQTLVGFAILSIVVTRAVSDLQNLANLDTARSIALVPVLSLLFSPFLRAAVVMSHYEQVFLRLNMGRDKDARLKRYARRRIFAHSGLSLKRLRYLIRNHAVDIMHIETEDDVDRLLRDALNSQSSWKADQDQETQR